jgi:hypothetical protein
MHYLYCLSLIALVACSSSDPVPPTLGHYISAQEALAADDFDKARAALQNLAQHADPSLVSLAKEAANAADITAVRTAFKPLSEEFIKGEVPEGYVLAYCPMADGERGAHWIQKDQPQLMNPYFGATMLHCGVFKE